MIRVLPAVVEFALLLFCLIDCIQTDRERVRNLPKALWIVLVLLVPFVGGVAWLVAGRPARAGSRGPAGGGGAGAARAPRAPGFPEESRARAAGAEDIDERVAREQARVDAEHEAAVRRAQARAQARRTIERREPGD